MSTPIIDGYKLSCDYCNRFGLKETIAARFMRAVLCFQKEVEVGIEGKLLGVLDFGLEDLHLVGLADERELAVLEEEGGSLTDGSDGGFGVNHDVFLQAVVACFATMLGVEEIGVVGIDLEGDDTHAVERGGHDDGHVVGGAESGASDVATCAPTHIGHAVESTLTDGLHEAGALQFTYKMEGIATTYSYAIGVVYCIDGQRLVVDRGELDAELFIDGSNLCLVGIVALGKSARGEGNACVGDEQYFLYIMTIAEIGNHIFAPAEVGFAAHGAVADEEKISFIHGEIWVMFITGQGLRR